MERVLLLNSEEAAEMKLAKQEAKVQTLTATTGMTENAGTIGMTKVGVTKHKPGTKEGVKEAKQGEGTHKD